MTHAQRTPQSPFLSDLDNAARYGVTRQTIWKWAKKGKFPKPVKLNGATRWKLTDIEAWEASQGGAA